MQVVPTGQFAQHPPLARLIPEAAPAWIPAWSASDAADWPATHDDRLEAQPRRMKTAKYPVRIVDRFIITASWLWRDRTYLDPVNPRR